MNLTQHLYRNVRAILLHSPLLSVAPTHTPTCKVMVWKNCLGHIETCRNISLSILSHFHCFIAMSSYLYDTNFSDPLPPISLHWKDREFTGVLMPFLICRHTLSSGTRLKETIGDKSWIYQLPAKTENLLLNQPFKKYPDKQIGLVCHEIYIQIDRSYFFLRLLKAEIWPGKSGELVEHKRGKPGDKTG